MYINIIINLRPDILYYINKATGVDGEGGGEICTVSLTIVFGSVNCIFLQYIRTNKCNIIEKHMYLRYE